MASKNFIHSGKVLSVEQNYIRVGFEAKGACGSCQARSKCGMVDSTNREIDVDVENSSSYNVGDEVNIGISYEMGIMSVFIAYIMPLIILISVLAIAVFFGLEEGFAALISLGSVAIYFVVVYLFRDKLEKQIKFTIENK